MTNTERDGHWDNNLEAPFSKIKQKQINPGPGQYLKDSKIEKTHMRKQI